MKTRKKIGNRLHKLSAKKNKINRTDFYPAKNDMTHLLNQYENRIVELETKQAKFKSTLAECLKWKTKIKCTDFIALKFIRIPNIRCTYENIGLRIKSIENILSKINKEHSFIIALCEVSYRSYYGLLHTLPKRKLKMIESIFPNIHVAMTKSKMNYKPTYRHISKPQKIKFGKVYIQKFLKG